MMIKRYDCGERPPEFYCFVGMLALCKEVTKELHDLQYGSMYDDPFDAVWWIYYRNNNPIGCCAAYRRVKDVYLDNTYVLPKYRGQGVGKQLFEARLEYCEEMAMPLKVITKNPVQAHIYEKFGFELSSKRGKYLWYKKEVLSGVVRRKSDG